MTSIHSRDSSLHSIHQTKPNTGAHTCKHVDVIARNFQPRKIPHHKKISYRPSRILHKKTALSPNDRQSTSISDIRLADAQTFPIRTEIAVWVEPHIFPWPLSQVLRLRPLTEPGAQILVRGEGGGAKGHARASFHGNGGCMDTRGEGNWVFTGVYAIPHPPSSVMLAGKGPVPLPLRCCYCERESG